MAEAVVDFLETVHVHHDQAPRLAVGCGRRHSFVEAIVEQAAVRQTGQRVIEHPTLEILPLLFLLRNVPERADEDTLLPGLHLASNELERERRPILSASERFVRSRADLLLVRTQVAFEV